MHLKVCKNGKGYTNQWKNGNCFAENLEIELSKKKSIKII